MVTTVQQLTTRYHVKVDGADLPEDQIRRVFRVVVEQSLHLPDMCLLYLRDIGSDQLFAPRPVRWSRWRAGIRVVNCGGNVCTVNHVSGGEQRGALERQRELTHIAAPAVSSHHLDSRIGYVLAIRVFASTCQKMLGQVRQVIESRR